MCPRAPERSRRPDATSSTSEIGEPDFDTPANIRDAAKAALDAGWTHYGPPLGLPELRRAIAADATARKGFDVDPGCVVVTPGAKPIVYFALLALVGTGDEVVCPDPGFPTYASMIRHTGAMPSDDSAPREQRLPDGPRRTPLAGDRRGPGW